MKIQKTNRSLRGLKTLLGSGAMLAIGLIPVRGQHHVAGTVEPPATHGMLVFGTGPVYLYHLPMFGSADPGRDDFSPHRFQVILEAEFLKSDRPATDRYLTDRAAHPAVKVYTLKPAPFVLSGLQQKDPLRSFDATVFRGHFEKTGKVPILEDIAVQVPRVVHFQEFDPAAKKPASLEYLLFGRGDQRFLAHRLTRPSDFDQILAVRIGGELPGTEESGTAWRIEFPKMKNKASSRPKEGQHLDGVLRAGDTAPPHDVTLEVQREVYFEEGELRLPPRFETTSGEKRAGFP